MSKARKTKAAPKREPDRTEIARRKKRARSLAAVLIILLVGVGAALSLTVFFKIEEVRVEGTDRYYTQEQILAASDIKTGENIFLFSPKRTEEKLWAELPYISSVTVRRELPATVIIDVSVSGYTVALPYEGGCLMLSEKLKIVDNTAEPDSNTCVSGQQPSSAAVGTTLATDDENGTFYLEQVVASLAEHKILSMISDINVSDKLNLSVIYDNRIFVMLGTASNIDYKVSMLAEIAQNQTEPDETGYLDLSLAGKGTLKSGPLEVPEGYRKKAGAI